MALDSGTTIAESSGPPLEFGNSSARQAESALAHARSSMPSGPVEISLDIEGLLDVDGLAIDSKRLQLIEHVRDDLVVAHRATILEGRRRRILSRLPRRSIGLTGATHEL